MITLELSFNGDRGIVGRALLQRAYDLENVYLRNYQVFPEYASQVLVSLKDVARIYTEVTGVAQIVPFGDVCSRLIYGVENVL